MVKKSPKGDLIGNAVLCDNLLLVSLIMTFP